MGQNAMAVQIFFYLHRSLIIIIGHARYNHAGFAESAFLLETAKLAIKLIHIIHTFSVLFNSPENIARMFTLINM